MKPVDTPIDFIFAGDLVLDEPDPDHWLSGIAPALHTADVAIAHLEVPHTLSTGELKGDVPAPGSNPEYIGAIRRAGIHAVTLAGNHIADCGAQGIADTIAELERAQIQFTGAGANIVEANKPAILHHAGNSIALLSFNCVGPETAWASATKAGCAYVRVETAKGEPIAPAASLDRVTPETLQVMANHIALAKRLADVVVVAFHKGIVHTPAKLAPYERALTHAAIDAGCDIVIGHHAHIVRGIERYKNKPIFHGLGNGCVVTRALSPDQAHPARAAWARKRKELFGFEPDPAFYLAPFHPEAVNAMLGRVRWYDDQLQFGFIPVHVEAPGRPVIAKASQATAIASYIESITLQAGLPPITTTFDGECVWIH